jgi:polar amino acid transport system substrate-binding protein
MMQPIIRIIFCFFFVFFAAGILQAEPIHIYTEEFPPFNFTENGKITGMSTEIVEAVMKQAKIEYVIESLPWARGYQNAQDRPNALIYSMSRLPKREALFKWIGVITPSDYSVFALKERTDIEIKNLDDMKKYKIGTTLGDARETYLVSKGFELEKLDRVGGEEANVQNFQKLKTKRIDLWPMPDAVAYYILKKSGDDLDKVLRKVFELSELTTGGYYLAASLQTSDDVVNKLKNSLEAFKKTPDYKELLKKWGLKQ